MPEGTLWPLLTTTNPCFALSLSGPSPPPLPDGQTAVTLSEVAHSIFYAPQYAAIELGYFEEEGIDLTLINVRRHAGKGIGLLNLRRHLDQFMVQKPASMFIRKVRMILPSTFCPAQGQEFFLVGRQAEEDFNWQDLRGKTVLGGRAGGMPQMVFEYILKKNGLDPVNDLTIDQSISFGLTAAAFTSSAADYTIEFEPFATTLEMKQQSKWRLSEQNPAMYPIRPTAPEKAI